MLPDQKPFDERRGLPIPKFVELVETNPDVTSAFAPHPRPFDPSTSSGRCELGVQIVELSS